MPSTGGKGTHGTSIARRGSIHPAPLVRIRVHGTRKHNLPRCVPGTMAAAGNWMSCIATAAVRHERRWQAVMATDSIGGWHASLRWLSVIRDSIRLLRRLCTSIDPREPAISCRIFGPYLFNRAIDPHPRAIHQQGTMAAAGLLPGAVTEI